MRRRRKGLHFYKKKKKINAALVRELFSWLLGCVLSAFLAFMLVYFIGMRTTVIGPSMEPSLHSGQGILVNRFIYLLSSPKQGDVVVFRPNGNQNAYLYAKRVAACPGQTVVITRGVLYVDGIPYREAKMDLIAAAGIAENELTLEKGQYFVLGDNPNNSEDSRSANLGPIEKADITGKAWFHLGSETDGWGFIH